MIDMIVGSRYKQSVVIKALGGFLLSKMHCVSLFTAVTDIVNGETHV